MSDFPSQPTNETPQLESSAAVAQDAVNVLVAGSNPASPATRCSPGTASEQRRFAYADPPYLGRGEYYRAHHPDAMIWDKPETHRTLIERLQADYSDGWALSLSERSLRTILPMCPPEARTAAWCTDRARYAGKAVPVRKHFEPVIFCGGRDYADTGNRTADFIITKQEPLPVGSVRYAMNKPDLRSGKTFVGRKPQAFSLWVLDLLGWIPGDTIDDLFPGSGAVQAAWSTKLERPSLSLSSTDRGGK